VFPAQLQYNGRDARLLRAGRLPPHGPIVMSICNLPRKTPSRPTAAFRFLSVRLEILMTGRSGGQRRY
jgi:hypothetical protein